MDCNNCQELFSEYLDRLMDEPQLLPFEKHLEECPGCAEEWESFAAAVSWVRQMQFAAPAGIMEGIRQKIAGGRPPGNTFVTRLLNFLRFQDFSLPLPAAAATLAVALLAMLAVKNFSPGNLPLFPSRQTPEKGNIAQSETTDRPGAAGYPVSARSMYQRPDLNDAVYADQDGFLPMQQLGPQLVTTGNGSAFVTDSALAPSVYSKEVSRQFFSMLAGHMSPDVRIQVNNLPIDSRLHLSRQLLNNPAWEARHFGSDTILLQMDPCKLKKLHGLLAGQNILIIPPDATDTAFGSPKKVLNVAIRLR